ncbi:related to HNM1-Choline permease [Phialocephala subalpina]|uniref:Related to HNM1-Choline permease n=1 Tax=Phialocephala subalpina TaxID=576137 RepID=A0A1L7WMS2_9HELO|nr:related to HNM1-Choline permease [Phialocephala subalpina]
MSVNREIKTSTAMPDEKSEAVEVTNAPQQHELRQQFSVWSLGSLCLCLMATWEALSTVVATALISGGAPCLFYNYLTSFLGTVAVACSLAEIASMYPTAGGQYHWVALLAPSKSSISASWFTGWISCGGQIVLTASAAFSGGLQLQALITLNHEDSYIPQRWQGMLFYWLVLAYSLVLNLWGSKILAHTNLASGVIHIVGFVAIIVVLAIMAPKQSPHFVFVEVSNTSGWSNNGISWLVGLLSSVYPFLGYDSATHMAEEMRHPARDVPIAMLGSVIVNGVMGLGYCVILLYSIGNLNDLLASPTGFPVMQLLLNVTKNPTGATLLCLTWTSIAVAANSAGLTSTSRTAWAFARDDAVPFSRYFAHVDSVHAVPTRMIICISVIQMLLGFLYLGSVTAFNAVLSMAILGMYASYILPIIYMVLYGRKLGAHKPGPFTLGGVGGMLTNVVAIAWLAFAMLFSMFPNYQPVTAQNMNYCVVVMGGWLFFGSVYFFWFGRKRYNGPVIEVLEMVH